MGARHLVRFAITKKFLAALKTRNKDLIYKRYNFWKFLEKQGQERRAKRRKAFIAYLMKKEGHKAALKKKFAMLRKHRRLGRFLDALKKKTSFEKVAKAKYFVRVKALVAKEHKINTVKAAAAERKHKKTGKSKGKKKSAATKKAKGTRKGKGKAKKAKKAKKKVKKAKKAKKGKKKVKKAKKAKKGKPKKKKPKKKKQILTQKKIKTTKKKLKPMKTGKLKKLLHQLGIKIHIAGAP